MSRRIYVSVPISGRDPETVRRHVARAERRIRASHFEPVSPLANGLPPSAPWAAHMREDLRLLLTCDAIVMLPGWQSSDGCCLELQVAARLGLDVGIANPYDYINL